jgi:hypothetical protein
MTWHEINMWGYKKPTFKLEFKTGTAFDGDPTDEISWVLGRVTERVQNGGVNGVIRDVNGNVIGEYELTEAMNNHEISTP